MLSYYQILQVEESATETEIKQAYRKLSKVLHPDLNNNTPEANAIFLLLQQAYETLSDPLKRKVYDIDPSPINSEESDNVRIESYKKQNEKQGKKLKEYEEQIKDYKEEIYLNSKRERELIHEVNDLKGQVLTLEKSNLEKLIVNQDEPEIKEELISKKQKGLSFTKIILIIIGANVALFISYFAIRSFFGFIFY